MQRVPENDRTALTIVHELPGRIRMGLSRAPRDVDHMRVSVMEHPGILSVDYTPVTRSVLVRFAPREVAREEIIIRVGLSLSLDYGAVPVRVLTAPESREMSESAFYSGLLVATAFVSRLFGGSRAGATSLDWLAALGTSGAVVDHAWREVRKQGYFDPEVVSLVYLVTSFLRGNLLPASLFTWATAFGRHLVKLPAPGVELRPVRTAGGEGCAPSYEVVISPDRSAADPMKFFSIVPSIVRYAVMGGGDPGRFDLLGEIRRVADLHGEVLEGLGELRQGIPIRVR